MELYLKFSQSVDEFINSVKNKHKNDLDTDEKFKWIRYFFQECYEYYETLVSKSYISSMRFNKKFYRKFVLPYINLDSVYCRDNIVSHIDMEPLMESFETGFKKYLESSLCSKCEKVFFKYIKSDYDRFNEIVEDDNLDSDINPSDVLELFCLCITTCLLKQYKQNIVNIITNHKSFKNLSPLVNDCEIFYSHNLRNVINTYKYFETEYAKIDDLSTKLNTINYAEIRYRISNLMKYINPSYDKLSVIIDNFKQLPKEYSDTNNVDCIKNLIFEYIDRILKVQKFNVINYNIQNSIEEWFDSDMNFIFTYDFIKDKINIIKEKYIND